MDRLSRLIRLMPKLYRPASAPVLHGILQAIAAEDEAASVAIADAKDQLFVQRASNQFLDYLGANVGVRRPTIIAFIDALFRELIPVLSFWPKQIKPSIYKALELFWTIDYLHSTAQSASFEPFVFVGGESLSFIVDKIHNVSVVFLAADFANPGAVTAQEVVDRINAWVPEYVIATTYTDHAVNRTYVRISTRTYGLAGSIQVTGGNANAILNFDTQLHQHTKVSLHEIHPNELVVRIPKRIHFSLDTIRWAHRFHPNATIVDSRPLIDATHPYWPGHFFFDRNGGNSIQVYKTQTTLDQAISTPLNYGTINLINTSNFPNSPGYLVFAFGLERQEVVKYFLRPGDTTLRIDPTHTFQHNFIPGDTVNLAGRFPYMPKNTGEDLEIFFVDTEIAQALVESLILLLKAAGVVVRWVLEDS